MMTLTIRAMCLIASSNSTRSIVAFVCMKSVSNMVYLIESVDELWKGLMYR